MNTPLKKELFVLGFSLLLSLEVASQGISFYVSPTGNDINPGTTDQPFATLNKAKEAVEAGATGNYTIRMRGGTYCFDRTVLFCNLGQKKVAIENYGDEKVVFSGGTNLQVSGFSLVKDKEILDRLRPGAWGKVVAFDLKANGIPFDSSLLQSGFGHKIRPSACMLYFNKELLQTARWPNEGKLSIGKVIDPGSKPRWDEPPYRGAVFKYDYDRAENWTKANDIWIYGVFSNGFSDDNLKVESFDIQDKILKTVQPHTYGVFSNKDKSTWDLAHARQLRGYYVYNLLEEIDLPGEYYLDRETGKLYLWPPSSLEKATIELSELTEPFLVFYNTSGVSVSGIDFECSRGMGIFMDDVSDIRIANCSFSGLSLLGISVSESYSSISLPSIKNRVFDPEMQARNIIIESCKFYKTGAGGIFMTGGDRKKLIPANNIITNCEFYDYSKIRKTDVTAIDIKGVGNIISHCYIHDAPHMAIHFWGNNHLIEYNHIQNVCTNTSDAGAIYAGRDPSAQGTIIRNNFFDSVIQSENLVCAVYLDDGICGISITDNIFYRCGNPEKKGSGFGAFHINGGYGNFMGNNVFIECKRAYGSSLWNDKKWVGYLTRGVVPGRLAKVDIDSKVYQDAYPMLKNLRDTLNLPPRVNYTSNDLLVRCGDFAKGSYRSKSFWKTNDDPGFVDMKNNDFTIRQDAELFKKLPGFRNISFEKIGLKNRQEQHQ